MARQLRIWAAATGALALLGVVAGLLWAWTAPRSPYLIYQHKAWMAEPDGESLISADGHLAVIVVILGLLSGGVAYLLAGRRNDLALITGLATGGAAGSLVGWAIGHRFGLAAFEEAVRTAPDGTRVDGALSLGAHGVVLLWPLAALIVFGLLESLDVARRSAPSDVGDLRAREGDEIGGAQLDLEPAPPRRDVDGPGPLAP
ncbi:hypothetical protein GCM10010468_66680 [Actinocorallia longicatena]|uniref:DUF2567 domain-containing protein n=1 Tax=Actinocorallia longicatena TaxID=111803 RepID=A0ABP6QLR0_9ACTN